MLAKIIWAFDIVKIEGEAYDANAFEGGMVLKPREFKCGFEVRSEGHRGVMIADLRDADRVLEKFPAFE